MCECNWIAEHIVEIITAIVATGAAVVAYKQWRSDAKFNKMNIVYELMTETRCNKNLAGAFYLLEWDGCGYAVKYDGSFSVENNPSEDNPKTANENDIDLLLSVFSYICQLYKQGILKSEDIKSFDYRLTRISHGNAICNYLYSLYHFAAAQGTTMSFIYLVDYYIEKGYLSKDFKCPHSGNYKYYLNKEGKFYKDYLERHHCEYCSGK